MVRLRAEAFASDLGSWVPPVGEGDRSNSFNLSATIVKDVEDARESIDISSGLVLMNWETILLVFCRRDGWPE